MMFLEVGGGEVGLDWDFWDERTLSRSCFISASCCCSSSMEGVEDEDEGIDDVDVGRVVVSSMMIICL